jgi:flagellar hook-length control protein FliK
MTITLIDNLSQSSSNPNIGTLELKSDQKAVPDGQSFGQFMSEIFQVQAEMPTATAQHKAELAELQGQEIAATVTLSEQATVLETASWSLKAVTLGPHLSVITPETSPPDSQSLEAFARAQGLDETAVNWLFGGQAGTMPAITLAPPSGTNAMTSGSAIGLLASVTGVPTSTPPITQAASLVPDIAQTSDGPVPPTANTQSITTMANSAVQGSVTSTALPGSVTNTALPGSEAMPTNAQGHPPAGPVNGVLNGQNTGAATGLLGSTLAAAQALLAMADAPEQTPKTSVTNSTSTSTSTEDALSIQMLRMPPPAAVWMQRSVVNNVLQNSVSNSKEDTISLSELDLGADWGGETLQQLLGAEVGVNSASSTGTHGTAYANFASRWDAQASNRTDLSNTNGPAPDLPDTQARSENIQNLAEKMGQAVGQRILSEMEKGQWHLKLQLRPATLGHIEVEMRMRSGEFDAVFTAPNGITRELLQDGMSKLRETLSQMGMDVANIQVGGGQTGQSGGDSTPGFSSGKTAQAQVGTQETTTEITQAPRVKDPKDGLDVLV